MPVGHYVVVSLGKTLNANFLTGSLCGVERQHKGLFHNAFTGKKLKKQIKKQVDIVLPVSPKVDLGNCPMLNVWRFPTSQEDK